MDNPEKELKELLDSSPRAREYQEELDKLLENSPDKMQTLCFLMEKNIQELKKELEDLLEMLK